MNKRRVKKKLKKSQKIYVEVLNLLYNNNKKITGKLIMPSPGWINFIKIKA